MKNIKKILFIAYLHGTINGMILKKKTWILFKTNNIKLIGIIKIKF